jgi:hypothetical protein
VKRSLYLPLAALLALAPAAHAGHLFSCCNWGIHCMVPPPECPDCSDACGHKLCLPWQAECSAKLIDQLCHGACCCERIKAAEKLGCCVYANWGSNPEVIDALVGALECDTCWEVRRAAAWSIARQGARTHYTVVALYLASKCDHHYMVRDRAAAALDELLLCNCQRECYKVIFESIDAEAGKIKPYYNPTNEQCVHLEPGDCCIIVHVCTLEKKAEKKKCLIPIKIVNHGPCPTCHAHAELPPPGALPPPGLMLPAPPPGAPAPERLGTPPAPVTPPAR